MIRGFDGFRALAFLGVFVFHLFAGFGYLGVQAFFVLSGFLITQILVTMKSNRSAGDYFRDFYGRRSIRIFPLYYLYLLLATLVMVTSAPAGREAELYDAQLPWAAGYALNFLQASDRYGVSHVLSHLWSLAVEEQFYLVWPLLIFVVPQRRLQLTLLVIMLLGPVIRGIEYLTIEHVPWGWNKRTDLAIYMLPFSHVDAFATGGFFALYVRSSDALRRSVVPALVVLVVVGLASAKLNTGSAHWSTFGYDLFMRDSGKFLWGYTAINLISAVVLVELRRGDFAARLFENPQLMYIGKISYGLYVYHHVVIWGAQLALPGKSGIVHALVALPVSIAISALSFRFFEQPLLKLKDRYFGASSSRGAPEALASALVGAQSGS